MRSVLVKLFVVIFLFAVFALLGAFFFRKSYYVQSVVGVLGSFIWRESEYVPASSMENSTYAIEYRDNEDALWQHTIEILLKEQLWNTERAAEAGHLLMIPMYMSFQEKNSERISQFRSHFLNFFDRGGYSYVDFSDNNGRFYKMHYLHLISWYCVLSLNTEFSEDKICESALNITVALWYEIPAWFWDRESFPGIRARLDWKLQVNDAKYSYYKAITEEELFIFALAANWIRYLNFKERGNDKSYNKLLDITDYALRTFNSRVSYLENENVYPRRWVFQPGFWRDHPDFAFSGNEKISFILFPKEKPDVVQDSGHFYRMPLWLISLAAIGPSEQRRYYRSLLAGIEKQFFEVVIYNPKPKMFLLRNYMDGWNGVYRWNYSSHPGRGYGPYTLTGSLYEGWWAFLPGIRAKNMYLILSDSFPPNPELVPYLLGAADSKLVEEVTNDPSIYDNGLKQLICRLASRLGDPVE